MRLQVREMAPSDLDCIFLMFVELYDHLNEKGFTLQLNKKNLKALLQSQLTSNMIKIFVLESNSTLAGFINVSTIKANAKFLSPHGELIGSITELYLKPEYRGNAYATLLIKRANTFFRDLGVSLIQVNTMVQNTDAIRFYKRQGFQENMISFLSL